MRRPSARPRSAAELAARASGTHADYTSLPPDVDPADLVVSVPLREQPDPGIEPDPDRAFVLRNA